MKIEICRIFEFIESFDPPKYLIYRIVRFIELFDFSNRLIYRFFGAPNFKNRKKYGYNISSVNGVAEFVKERLYPYNGTEQVLLDGIALECFNIEGQGSKDSSVSNIY